MGECDNTGLILVITKEQKCGTSPGDTCVCEFSTMDRGSAESKLPAYFNLRRIFVLFGHRLDRTHQSKTALRPTLTFPQAHIPG